MAREKASKNQNIIAEALRLARERGFNVGLQYMIHNTDVKNFPTVKSWFSDKCSEHNIAVPSH